MIGLKKPVVYKSQKRPEGLVIGFKGRRRRGKSLSMVGLGYGLSKQFGYPVISNFKCHFALGLDSDYPGMREGRVILDEILKFPPELKNCVIMWDEIDRIFLSMRRNTLVTEFLENGLTQLGKRNIYMLWALQNVQRLNSFLYWQTDVLIECDSRDGGYTVPWILTDLHGAWSYPGRTAKLLYHNAWRLRNTYDTREMFDPMERLTVGIKR